MMRFSVLVLVSLVGSCVGFELYSLPKKVGALMVDVDDDGDGLISNSEVRNYASTKMDANNDGCVSEQEWVNYYTNETIQFSTDYSRFSFRMYLKATSGLPNQCKGVLISNLVVDFGNTVKTQLKEGAYTSNVMKSVINFCVMMKKKAYMDDDCTEHTEHAQRFLENTDCKNLAATCQISVLSCTYACLEFNFDMKYPGKGPTYPNMKWFSHTSLEDSMDKFLSTVDDDSDGRVNGAEALEDDNDDDINDNGCVNRLEFLMRMTLRQCDGYGFSQEMTENRYKDILANNGEDPTCGGVKITASPPGSTVFTTDELFGFQIKSLSNLCDRNQTMYHTNRDCNQLLRLCMFSKYKVNAQCMEYVDRVLTGKSGYNF